MLRFTTVGEVFTKSGKNSKCRLSSKFRPPIDNSRFLTGLQPKCASKE